MEAHAVAREDVPVTRHQQRACRQLPAPRQALVAILDDIHLVQPVVERGGGRSVLATHIGGQRLEPGNRDRRVGTFLPGGVNRHFSRRQIAEPGCCLLEAAEAYAVQALAQHRFQRVFPAGLDLDVLPQAARRIETVRFQPALHFFAARNAVLHLLERNHARLERGHLVGGGIHRRALLAQRLLQLGNARLFGFELAAFIALLRIELDSLGTQAFKFQTIGRRQSRLLFAQPLFALRQLCQYLECMFATRLLELQRLRIFRYRLLQRIALLLAAPERLFRDRQLRRLCVRRCLARVGLLLGALLFLLPVTAARMLRLQLTLTLIELAAQCRQLIFNALPVLAHMLDLLLHARKLGIGLIQAALRDVQGVTGVMVTCAQFLELALGITQTRGFGFELDAEFPDVCLLYTSDAADE